MEETILMRWMCIKTNEIFKKTSEMISFGVSRDLLLAKYVFVVFSE